MVSAGVLVPLLHMLRVTPVLGYLIAGSVVGPFGLGLLADKVPMLSYGVISELDGVKALAELGIIFLLFMIGLELSFERLWAMRRLVFGLGSLQVLITATIIGVIAFRFGNSVSASIVLGACLTLSSTAIVMQLLMEGRSLGTTVGRSSFAILLIRTWRSCHYCSSSDSWRLKPKVALERISPWRSAKRYSRSASSTPWAGSSSVPACIWPHGPAAVKCSWRSFFWR